MLKKTIYEQSLATDGWTLFDPMDSGILERLSKKDILEGEEKLMLAVLGKAVEYFQKYVLAKDERGKKLFEEAEEWILDKNSDCSILLKISVRSLGYILITCVRGYCAGRRQGSSIVQSVSTFIAHVDIEADAALLLTFLPSLWLLLRASFTPTFKPIKSTVCRWFVCQLPLRDQLDACPRPCFDY